MMLLCAALGAPESSSPAHRASQDWATRLKRLLPFTSLFFSLSTLVCCALPALFVALGAGATFVSILGVCPQLIWLSENKGIVFSVAATLLTLNILQRRLAPRECPTDPQLALQCTRARRMSGFISGLSLLCLLVGAFFAFVAPYLF